MPRIDNLFDDQYEEYVDMYIGSPDRDLSTKARRARARRRIEEMQEEKALRRRLDDYYDG